jgi:hypothetical protein
MKIVLILPILIFLLVSAPCHATVSFSDSQDLIRVTTGSYNYTISKKKCTVFDNIAINSDTVAIGGEITYANGRNRVYSAGPPSKTFIQKDYNRISQEGWFQYKGEKDFLYYILRYEFYDNAPFVKLVVTFTDRHDKPKTEAQWDKYWNSQLVSNIKVELMVPGLSRQIYIEQHNAFDYKKTDEYGTKPYFDLEERKGAPYIFTESASPGIISKKQLQHLSSSKENWIRFYPMQKGKYPVSVIWNALPEYAAYLMAKGVVAKIRHTQGESSVIYDQNKRSSWLDLGTYVFDEKSYIDITGERKAGTLLVDAIRVGKDEISVFNRHDDHLSDKNFTLLVKDFWRNYPIGMKLEKGKATVDFIKEPSIFMGGMGKTFEIMYSFGNLSTAKKALYAPPTIKNGKTYSDLLYFSLADCKEYKVLTDEVRHNLLHYLETQRSLGWRNWGDYQIGTSYDQNEDWGNLQYDLAYGLLVLYIRTNDPEIWKLAQASIYHMMDLDQVKYSPFLPKYNGSVHRKGEMPNKMSHVSSEPIVPENFAFRGLYLYYLLTGDPFALDCARMSVDNFLEFTISDSRLDFASHGDRDTAWILLGSLFGYEKFNDSKYLEKATKVVNKLLGKEKTLGRLPGSQPVWQGQTVEALIKYYEITKNTQVRDIIIRHVKWLRDYAITINPATGRLKMIYLMKDTDFVPINPTWTDDSNYFFLHLNSFMYVYDLTKDISYKKLANSMFSQAFIDYKKFVGPRQASSYLSFPFYYLDKKNTK